MLPDKPLLISKGTIAVLKIFVISKNNLNHVCPTCGPHADWPLTLA